MIKCLNLGHIALNANSKPRTGLWQFAILDHHLAVKVLALGPQGENFYIKKLYVCSKCKRITAYPSRRCTCYFCGGKLGELQNAKSQ